MAFLGMRGTGDWDTDARPKNWRQQMLRQYPNGDMPLTAILSKMGSERTDDPEFKWWTKDLATQAATVTGVYTNTALDVAYVSGGVSGDTVYLKMSAADVKQWRTGMVARMGDASDSTMTVIGKTVARVESGANSYIGVYLLEADDNSSAGDLSDCDTALIVGSVNAEGAGMPDAISYDPVKWYNFTQIFRTPLEITRTAMKTRLRTYDQYKEAKREALELHGIEMEKAFLFGVSSELTGSNSKPERTTLGLVPAIMGGYTGHGGSAGTNDYYVTNATYAGLTWLQGGKAWLNAQLETIFKYGSSERLALCGSGAISAINALVEDLGQFNFVPQTKDYGIDIVQWTTPFGTIYLKQHKLLSQYEPTRKSMLLVEPSEMKYRYVDDTFFKKDDYKKGGWTSRDGLKEEWLTECGLEYHFPNAWGFLNGFGDTNTAS